jgi:Acyl-CoA reductase (LuxC)
MNLPDYFLADLPPEATLSPSMIAEACQTLRRNRERYLTNRSTEQIIGVLSAVALDWLQDDYPFRKLALERGPVATGFSRATLAHGLDVFFGLLTQESVHALIRQDLGHVQRLDAFSASDSERQFHQAALVRGPELLVHITAGNIPSPALLSIVLGLLVRSAQFVKCARESSLLPRLFAHSIRGVEPKLASCLELAEWPGGTTTLEEPLFAEADCLTATGSDETLAAIRSRLPQRTRFLGYGQQVSFGFVTRDALQGYGVKELAAAAAEDVVAWNQMGCLSPHVFYVQSGGALSPEQFAEQLAEELTARETTHPRGELTVHESAVISLKRDFYRVRAAAECETRIWHSEDSTAWTVVFEGDARFQVSCLNRFIYVKAVADLAEALQNAESVRDKTSTVGLAAPGPDARELATQLAHWGVTRICPLGQMQRPPLTWRHDGRPALGDLVTWTNWEQ